PDGVIKVLDFGLAKLVDSPGAASSPTISPTITSPALMTGVGVLLGTAAYMSPEQAKGRAADKRSDIWSFGCVLYEMLTGRRPFDGEDISGSLASVLKSDPDWTLLPSDVPPSIRRIIERCMMKDRRRRVGDIAVVQFVLTDEPGLAAADAPNHTGIERRFWRRPLAVGGIAGGLVAAIVAYAAWGGVRPRVPPHVSLVSCR